jgi:hypothetical protein
VVVIDAATKAAQRLREWSNGARRTKVFTPAGEGEPGDNAKCLFSSRVFHTEETQFMKVLAPLGRRVALGGAGVAVTTAAIVAVPATSALAAPSPSATQETTTTAAARNFTVSGGLLINPGRNLVGATGTIRDRTSGRDRVQIQVAVQRKEGRRWRTVARGPRVSRNDAATSTIRPGRCTNGKWYRALATYKYKNQRPASITTRAAKC